MTTKAPGGGVEEPEGHRGGRGREVGFVPAASVARAEGGGEEVTSAATCAGLLHGFPVAASTSSNSILSLALGEESRERDSVAWSGKERVFAVASALLFSLLPLRQR